MPARLIFKCEICGERAEGETQSALEEQRRGQLQVRERLGRGWRQGWGPTV